MLRLRCRLLAGRIRHQRRVYEGQHPSIIAPELWDAVQAQLQAGAAKPRRRTTKGRAARSLLAGKLFDETGDRLTPSHTKKKNGQRLRYYVSRRLIQHNTHMHPDHTGGNENFGKMGTLIFGHPRARRL